MDYIKSIIFYFSIQINSLLKALLPQIVEVEDFNFTDSAL